VSTLHIGGKTLTFYFIMHMVTIANARAKVNCISLSRRRDELCGRKRSTKYTVIILRSCEIRLKTSLFLDVATSVVSERLFANTAGRREFGSRGIVNIHNSSSSWGLSLPRKHSKWTIRLCMVSLYFHPTYVYKNMQLVLETQFPMRVSPS
jgi:hypothetical protein